MLRLCGITDISQLIGDFMVPFGVDAKYGHSAPKTHRYRIEGIVASVLRIVRHSFDYRATNPVAFENLEPVLFDLFFNDPTTEAHHDGEIEPLNFKRVLGEVFVFVRHSPHRLFRRIFLRQKACRRVEGLIGNRLLLLKLPHIAKFVPQSIAPSWPLRGRQ